MQSRLFSLLVSAFLLCLVTGAGRVAPDDKASLQGVWSAESMEADGKPAPAEVVKWMRLTFKGDNVLFRGNFGDDREEECSFKIDATKSPRHFDFTPPNQEKPILGIYEITGDKLRICLRHGGSSAGRPTEFSTKPESGLILTVFKRATAK
jgi:uncharacterized protein (TIGR03067 family)